MSEDQKIARLWYEIKNMTRYDIEWEWISEQENGEYLERKAVLDLVEKFLDKRDVREKGKWTREPPTKPGWYRVISMGARRVVHLNEYGVLLSGIKGSYSITDVEYWDNRRIEFEPWPTEIKENA